MSKGHRAWRGGRADWKLHVLSTFSLAVAFVCLASALLVVFNLDSVRQRWARAGRASIFLRDGTTEAMVSELRVALKKTPGVTGVGYVFPADARHEIVGEAGDSTLAALPSEAFPASVEIQVSDGMTDNQLAAINASLKQIPSVESVETYQRYTDKLQSLLHAGVVASLVLALIVLAAVVSVVGSTVRLALQRRNVEIEVLRLVGATENYVRRPFVVEGCMQGAAGAGGAIALLGIVYLIIHSQVRDVVQLMLGVSPTFLPWYAVLGLIGLGASLGAISSHVSLRRMVIV